MKFKLTITSLFLLAVSFITGCTGDTYSELQLASARGQTDMVAVMLEDGADVNQINKHGKTPLMLAAGNNHPETTAMLLERDAAIDAQDVDGMTALIMASSSGHVEVIKVLMESGADINGTNKYGATAITNAAFFNHIPALNALLNGKVKANIERNENALLFSAGLGNNDIIKILLDYGVNVNAKGKNGRTPLMAAVEFNHPATVKMLMENNADPKTRDSEGESIEAIAEDNGNRAIIDLIKGTSK